MSTVPLAHQLNLIPQVGQIVSAYTKRNDVSKNDLEYLCNALQRILTGTPSPIIASALFPSRAPAAIQSAAIQSNDHSSMNTIPEDPKAAEAIALQPAVPVEDSVQPDFIICLEDGAKVKLLKRYIQTRFDLTPAQYRAKWNLAPDYPMTPANYSKRRSELARAIGLGQTGGEVAPDDEPISMPLAEEPIVAITAGSEADIPSLVPAEDLPVDDAHPASDLNGADPAEAKPASSRPILRLAAWQKPTAPKTETDDLPVMAPETAAVAPKPAEETVEPQESSPPPANRGFRYPVNRYSR